MFESTKDAVKYERREGHESWFVNTNKDTDKYDTDDGWLTPVTWDKAKEADVWVMHSLIPERLKGDSKKKACVAVLHGPNEHMLWKEFVSERKEQAFNLHINILWQYDATEPINQHEYEIMKLYVEVVRLLYIPNSIDLERVDANGYAWKYEHRPAIISCDVLRLEKLPAHIIWAMPRIVEKIPDARLNIYSLALEPISTWRNLFCRSKDRKLEYLCENIQLENRDLMPFVRGADIGFNNNVSGILSRVCMEMMAVGVPVISYGGPYTPYIAKIWDMESIADQVYTVWADLTKPGSTTVEDTKERARECFDRAKEVKKFIALYEKLLGSKK